MPTEEIFTTPDSRRAEGTITSTRPLALSGDVVEGLKLTVKDGKIVDVDATHGADVVRAELASDERASRLRRGRARRRRVARRPDRADVLRHALRRERDLPHRLRLRDPRDVRGRAERGHERLDGAHRLHDRRARGRGRRPDRGRRGSADPARGSCGSSRPRGPGRAVRRARRPGRRERPAGPARRGARPGRARRRRARGHAQRPTAPARATSTCSTPTSTCGAR